MSRVVNAAAVVVCPITMNGATAHGYGGGTLLMSRVVNAAPASVCRITINVATAHA